MKRVELPDENKQAEVHLGCDNCGMYQWQFIPYGSDFSEYLVYIVDGEVRRTKPARADKRIIMCNNCGSTKLKVLYWDKDDYDREHNTSKNKNTSSASKGGQSSEQSSI